MLETFAELLTAYMDRTGIGDAELARRIPVSRPTLLRWKEGVTTRPRYREDVIRCAELLRLTVEETNGLLLAAGFSPEMVPQSAEPPPSDNVSEVRHPSSPRPLPEARRRGHPLRIAGIAASTLLIVVVAVIVASALRDTATYPNAADGESLIVMAPFVNYTAGGQGFNVVGRLRAAIDREVNEAGLKAVRTVEWPNEIEGEEAAEQAGTRSDATLVVQHH